MYNNVYDDYIRSIIGVSNNYSYFDNNMNEDFQNLQYSNHNQINNMQLEECYPEIYKLIYPMVKKVCMKNTGEISKQLINEMTQEVYMNFVQENETTQININLNNNVRGNNTINTNPKVNKTNEVKEKEENRQIQTSRNSILNDLIKILILRELLGKTGEITKYPYEKLPYKNNFVDFNPYIRPRKNILNNQFNFDQYQNSLYENEFDIYE